MITLKTHWIWILSIILENSEKSLFKKEASIHLFVYLFFSWKSITDHLLTHEKTMFKDLMSKLLLNFYYIFLTDVKMQYIYGQKYVNIWLLTPILRIVTQNYLECRCMLLSEGDPRKWVFACAKLVKYNPKDSVT